MSEEKNTDMQELSLEQAFVLLDELIGKMQATDVSLEEAFALYKKGVTLVELCNKKIEKVECDIRLIDEVEAE